MPAAPREDCMSSMLGGTNWTRAMLERLRELHTHGLSEQNITSELFREFGAPSKIGEVKAELHMLKSGPKPLE
ncbi:MAG: hypothetical protein Q9195_003861 [Heterodermia aff. obscurata]